METKNKRELNLHTTHMNGSIEQTLARSSGAWLNCCFLVAFLTKLFKWNFITEAQTRATKTSEVKLELLDFIKPFLGLLFFIVTFLYILVCFCFFCSLSKDYKTSNIFRSGWNIQHFKVGLEHPTFSRRVGSGISSIHHCLRHHGYALPLGSPVSLHLGSFFFVCLVCLVFSFSYVWFSVEDYNTFYDFAINTDKLFDFL